MRRSSSKSSFTKRSQNQRYVSDRNKSTFARIQSILQEASANLPYLEFKHIFQNILRTSIKRCQIQNTETNFVQFLKKMTQKYEANFELVVKIMMLEALQKISVLPQESLNLLVKIKHMIVDTEIEYLLAKVFVIEAKVYDIMKRKDLIARSYAKCIQFAQTFVLEYLNEKEEIRKEISQTIVVAYFELYKLKKQESHKEAEQFIRKACRATQKNYGEQSLIAQILNMVYKEHKNVGKGLTKFSQSSRTPKKALTQIMANDFKKDSKIVGFYSWEDEKIVAQLVKTKNEDEKVISQTQYQVRLDMSKINQLMSLEWVRVQNGQVSIVEDEIMKIIGMKQQNTVTTRIGIKTISRDEIIKKDTLSSSSEDTSFIEKEDFNFIRRLGRAQSAKRPLNI